jgi:glutamine---fructose-6-phosphate transaminase (isomerizing)
LMHFYMLAEALADGGLKLGYELIPDFAARALELRPAVESLVERYVFMENCVVVGRGLIYANSFEMALKLMETCYVVAERFSSADFQHGPLAVVERHFPIFIFAPPGPTLTGVSELLTRLRELRADTLVFTSDEATAELSTRVVMLPAEINETLSVIPYVIPAQLFAALLAAAKGLDPDQPRSLSKVTRTL